VGNDSKLTAIPVEIEMSARFLPLFLFFLSLFLFFLSLFLFFLSLSFFLSMSNALHRPRNFQPPFNCQTASSQPPLVLRRIRRVLLLLLFAQVRGLAKQFIADRGQGATLAIAAAKSLR
jgi:hypothetical protein